MQIKSDKAEALLYECFSPRIQLSFAPAVLAHFRKHKQTRFSKSEVGGQLFAEFEGDLVKILRATGPNAEDKRSWTSFLPSPKRQNAEIKDLFRQRLYFVGDWHTHPEDVPTPSALDLNSMQDCFRRSQHELKAFVMVIVGRAPFPRGLWVSLHNASGCFPVKASVPSKGA